MSWIRVLWCGGALAVCVGHSFGCGEAFSEGATTSSTSSTSTSTTGTSSGTATTSATGGSGGATASVGSGQVTSSTGGAGGSSGVGGAPHMGCGSSVDGMMTPQLYTTLQDESAILMPQVGKGNDAAITGMLAFPAALTDNGAAFQANGDVIMYRAVADQYVNLYTRHGAVDFCFKPNFNSNDGANHILMSALPDNSNAELRIRKAGSANGNEFQVAALGAMIGVTSFSPTEVPFVAGQWMRLTVTWNFDAGMGDRQVHVYRNGIEATPIMVGASPGLGPHPMPTQTTTGVVLIGGNGGDSCKGVLDEFVIYGSPGPIMNNL